MAHIIWGHIQVIVSSIWQQPVFDDLTLNSDNERAIQTYVIYWIMVFDDRQLSWEGSISLNP